MSVVVLVRNITYLACVLLALPSGAQVRAWPHETIAEVRHSVDALVASNSGLYGASRDGTIFSITFHHPQTQAATHILSVQERNPFAICVRDDRPVWASRNGVFTSEPDGRQRKMLRHDDSILALACDESGIYFSTATSIWRLDAKRGTVKLVDGVSADEIIANDVWIAWLDHGKAGTVSVFDRSTKQTHQLGTFRKPHDLTSDGSLLRWHEGDADILPGSNARAFVADIGSKVVTPLAGEFDSSDQYLSYGGIVLGAAKCQNDDHKWIRFDNGTGHPPITSDYSADHLPFKRGFFRWYWVEDVYNGTWRVVGANLSRCGTPP